MGAMGIPFRGDSLRGEMLILFLVLFRIGVDSQGGGFL
jgi:hypothetical protein